MGSAGTVAILVQARDFLYKERIELNHSILYYHLQFLVAVIKHSSRQRQTPCTYSQSLPSLLHGLHTCTEKGWPQMALEVQSVVVRQLRLTGVLH